MGKIWGNRVRPDVPWMISHREHLLKSTGLGPSAEAPPAWGSSPLGFSAPNLPTGSWTPTGWKGWISSVSEESGREWGVHYFLFLPWSQLAPIPGREATSKHYFSRGLISGLAVQAAAGTDPGRSEPGLPGDAAVYVFGPTRWLSWNPPQPLREEN